MNYEFKENQVLTIDLHKFALLEAQIHLEKIISAIDTNKIREVIVIHGYNRGKRLQMFVREEFKSRKVERKFLCLNPGRTSLILKH